MADYERKREIFGDTPPTEFLVMRVDKIRVEIRKETNGHHEPHIHITHSDKIDASISLNTFLVLAGKIDKHTIKNLKNVLIPKKEKLLEIWNELNEKDNSVAVEKLIRNL